MQRTEAKFSDGYSITCVYDKKPSECPYCHKTIMAIEWNALSTDKKLTIVFRCPDQECQETFLGFYHLKNPDLSELPPTYHFFFSGTSIGTIKTRNFSDAIFAISSSFVEIYNQSLKSEEYALTQMSGMGYRKSLEFLIKDYLIRLYPEKEETIKKKFLGNCIKDDVTNPNVKSMADRATWIGNDETHYTKKWIDRDITDLKKLIEVTVHWIEMEITTQEYMNDMPEGRK